MSDFYLKEAEKSEWIGEGIERERDRILRLIDELKNPYPEDVFPKLTKEHLRIINESLLHNLNIPLDRLSAHLMKLGRDNLKEELKQKIGDDTIVAINEVEGKKNA